MDSSSSSSSSSSSIQNWLPRDIALKIASQLQVRDLCALGCCSRFWRELCSSPCVWKPLATHRWPFLASSSSSTSTSNSTHAPKFKEWKKLYIKRYREVSATASAVANFVEDRSPSESLEVGDYLEAVEDLGAVRFGFEDVQVFLFKPQLNVLLNLIGVHYCLTCLGIRGDDLLEALKACEISDRHVCIKWWKVGRWFYGFRMRNESHSRQVSLAELATEDGEHILGVLHRGAIHEVLRVQISAAHHTSTPWSCQVTQSQG